VIWAAVLFVVIAVVLTAVVAKTWSDAVRTRRRPDNRPENDHRAENPDGTGEATAEPAGGGVAADAPSPEPAAGGHWAKGAAVDPGATERAGTEASAGGHWAKAAVDETVATRSPGDQGERLDSLWELALLELRHGWGGEELQGAPGIAEALAGELTRIREETGTPGNLRTTLDAEPSPGDSLLALKATAGLLAVLVRHTQAYDVVLSGKPERLVVTVTCEGWEGPERVADDISELYLALRPAGALLEVDTDTVGRVLATLQLPMSDASAPRPADHSPGPGGH
jgi:hypothetical protein